MVQGNSRQLSKFNAIHPIHPIQEGELGELGELSELGELPKIAARNVPEQIGTFCRVTK